MTVLDPTPPVRATGSNVLIRRMKAADDSRAFLVSRTVSLYSGAKVAAASGAVDQIMIQIQTSTSCKPPQARWGWLRLKVRLEEWKRPSRKGNRVNENSGIISRTPAR